MFSNIDKTFFMSIALSEAKKAFKKGDVPVGACLVDINSKKLISKSYNKRMLNNSAIAHAEVLCIKKACKKFKDFRLTNTAMFVTLFPCPMCMGAIVNARIKNVYVGAPSDRIDNGLIENIFNNNLLNHKVEFEVGILGEECSDILKTFFKEHRNSK